MSKVKIKFLKDHDFFDEEPKSFNKGEVISLEETSANHYIKRGLAKLVSAGTDLCKPKRQIELPVEKEAQLDEKVVGLREKVSNWINGLLPDTKPEDAEKALAEILPKAEEDAAKVIQNANVDSQGIIEKAEGSAKGILQQANEEAKKIKDKK